MILLSILTLFLVVISHWTIVMTQAFGTGSLNTEIKFFSYSS